MRSRPTPPNMVCKDPYDSRMAKGSQSSFRRGHQDQCDADLFCKPGASGSRAGATYVSPFLGRIDDISGYGIDLVRQIADIFDVAEDIDTEIIAASIRNPIHVTDCALAGADIATVPYKVIVQMTKHPLTDAGIEKFQADYKAVFGE